MQQTDTINSIVVIDAETGAHVTYDGPFSITRDAGHFEVPVPLDQDDYASIPLPTAENLTDRVGDLLLTIADGEPLASGRLDAADAIDDKLVLRADDAERASTADLDIDPEEPDA
jgi:hypothetical protein